VIRRRQAAVHADDIGLGNIELLGDLLDVLGREIALLEGLDLALELAEIEEQLLLRGRRAHLHKAPRTQDVFLDGGADPPHGIRRQTEAAVGLEALHGLHQADIAFGDDFGNGQAIAAIAHGDLGHETQMAGDETMGRFRVFMLAPAFGEHVFLLRFQKRKLPDFGEISGKSALALQGRNAATAHWSLPRLETANTRHALRAQQRLRIQL